MINKISKALIESTVSDDVLGAANGATNMGQYTASFIPDNQTVKQNIEAIGNFINKVNITPYQFSAVGDGIADDGVALNDMFDFVRSLIASNPFTAVNVTGGNGKFRTTLSVDVTGIGAWSLTVKDIFIIGECTGKVVLDIVGTRGYVFDNVSIWGDKTHRPTKGIQAQRGVASGFCDNASFRDCNIDGWFSVACVHDYGQETTQWVHCTVFNRDHTARVAIHEGYSTTAMTSDYSVLMTGGTSFINKQFLNCDWRYLPADENIVQVTNITNATNAVVTANNHPFIVGDKVVFQYVAGMPDLSSKIGTVTAKTTNTFTLDINSIGLGTFGGSGNAIRSSTQSPVYICRTEGFAMHDCYIVAYGKPHIEMGFPDPSFRRLEQISFNSILFEGAGNKSAISFAVPVSGCTVQGFRLSTYNAHVFESLIENTSGSHVLSFLGFDISCVDSIFDIALTNNPALFTAVDSRILFTTMAKIAPASFAKFNGSITTMDNSNNSIYIEDALVLNGGRVKMRGAVSSGTAVPGLGSNKPGTAGDPASWQDIEIDGTTYCFPVWPKT